MSYSQDFRYNHLPCSQSHKMSIGMVVDSSDKPCSRSMKDAEVSISRAERQASGQEYARQTMNRDFMSFGTLSSCGDLALNGSVMIKTGQLLDKTLINNKNHIDKQASTLSLNLRGNQSGHQAVLQPVTGQKIETGGIVSRKEAKKDDVAERCGEFPCRDKREVSMPVKDMLHEQPDEMRNRCKETLRMNLREILGTIPSADKKYDDSTMADVVANEVLLVPTDKSDARLKHKQSSDTIETDSEKDDKTIRRPVTRLLARKRVTAKSRPVNSKTKPVSCDKDDNHVFSFVEKSLPSKSSEDNVRHSTEMFENSKQSCGINPDDLIHHTTAAVNIQQVTTEDKMPQRKEELSLRGRMTSPQRGCPHENLEPEAATHRKNIHCADVREKGQPTNAEFAISPEVSDHQISLISQSPVNHDDDINSPPSKVAKTVHNSIMSNHFCGFVPEEGKAVYQFQGTPTTEDNTGSSDDEDTYTPMPEPSTVENATNGLLSPEESEFDSSEEALPAEKVYPNNVHASSEKRDTKRLLLFQAKLHCSNGVDHINSIPSMQGPEACANDDDKLLKPFEEGPEDELARVVSLLGLALDRVKAKMMCVTNKRCSDILMSAAEEIHSQLCDFESQIQTNLGKLTNLSKLKRRHLDARLQEQEEHLKVIYDKFRKEIHQYVQDCTGAVEELEAQHAILKGATEKQRISQRRLFLQTKAAVESQLDDAQKQITSVRKLGRQKMLKLKVAMAECLKDGISG